jgi:hypothetical protein
VIKSHYFFKGGELMVMEEKFTITGLNSNILPTAAKPFCVEVMGGQPVGLRAFQQELHVGVPSAAILMTSSMTLPLPVLSEVALHAAVAPAVGIIIASPSLKVLGVLDSKEVRSGLSMASINRLSARGFDLSAAPAAYESLLGDVGEIQVLTYGCPVRKCKSPLVFIFQKGQEVPPCLIHNKPRILKRGTKRKRGHK